MSLASYSGRTATNISRVGWIRINGKGSSKPPRSTRSSGKGRLGEDCDIKDRRSGGDNQAADAGTLTGSASLATLNTAPPADVSVQADIMLPMVGAAAGMVTRYSGPDQSNFYLGMIYNNNGAYQAYLF